MDNLEGTRLQDDRYFESYENLDVHESMLADYSRTNTYRQAIMYKGIIGHGYGYGYGYSYGYS